MSDAQEIERLRGDCARLREKNRELALRADRHAKAVGERLDAAVPGRRTLGRALANAGYYLERERAETAEAERDALALQVAEMREVVAVARKSLAVMRATGWHLAVACDDPTLDGQIEAAAATECYDALAEALAQLEPPR